MDNPQGVHQICDRFVDDYCGLDPNVATYLGVAGHDDELTDYSPSGHAAREELIRTTRRAVLAAPPADTSQRVAQAVFAERTGVELELHDAGLLTASLNVIESPVQDLRQVFDLMPTTTAQDWTTIAARLAAVPAAVGHVRAALSDAAGRHQVSAIRQVNKVAEQCDTWSGSAGGASFFQTLVAGADTVDGVSPSLRAELSSAADGAAAAYQELAGFLRTELAPRAPEKDAVGAETYQLWSRYFTGADIDQHEAYQWGWQEFARLESEMKRVAGRIADGGGIAEAAAKLDAQSRYQLRGRDDLRDWMQRLSDNALKELRDTHFELPDALLGLECLIAPQGGGVGAYYTGPSEDFSRPGRMWWSLPADREEFASWREVSTVYHEGVPGHHLQIATAVYESQTLNRYQRLMATTSGHAEGWALYAERLMAELGYLADDGDRLGMLDSHLFRAARVIVDIGMHLELEIPSGTGFHEGERWTPELGLEFMLTRTITDPAHVRDEIDRYLGWPGQAPAYKLGERLWLVAREDAKAKAGDGFDLKDFHTRALRMGSMGLDTLREQLMTQ